VTDGGLPEPGGSPAVRASAGILLYRCRDGRLEVLVGHPGGPLWAKRDAGAWSIMKGEIEDGEEALPAAVREFAEETGHHLRPEDCRSLGSITQKSGKTVHAWACEGDLDPADAVSETFTMEWPPRSGEMRQFPEIDRVAWLDRAQAAIRLNPAQVALLDLLDDLVAGR